VPWCEDCTQYWRVPELADGSACPTCGRVLDVTVPKTPWHFKLLILALVVYLSYRAWQGIVWVMGRL